jgi:hypothetical protein
MEENGKVTIKVETDRSVPYSLYQQEDPLRLVLDLQRTSLGDFSRNIPVNSGTVGFIKPVAAPGGNSRLDFYLTDTSHYEIDSKGDDRPPKRRRRKSRGRRQRRSKRSRPLPRNPLKAAP